MATPLSPGDPNSFSRPEDAKVTNIRLNLNVDFACTTLNGYVVLSVRAQKPGVKSIILDAKDLKISGVKLWDTSEQLPYELGESVHVFGSKLEISLPVPSVPGECVSCNIQIDYETSSDASALQWLKPEQTSCKKHPYLFSQCQAIHARSIIPCQDTPSVKCPYVAEITVAKELVALMSAVGDGEEVSNGGETRTFRFAQKNPIPSYLIAIVVGDLDARELGPRSRVWAERDVVEKAAYEFAETEFMLTTAENLMGEYVWERYDLVVMPPSFPYGGMENPCLTFVTPTLLAGDRSLADVVAHEIAHSWTGNLVTNRNGEHFWINEGHTMFVQRKIQARMALHPVEGQATRHFDAAEGWKALEETVKHVLGEEHEYTKLVPNLAGVDPDDAFSVVPYEKGHTLLFYLEELVGGPAVFEPFLRSYIETFRYMSISTTQWKDYLLKYFEENQLTTRLKEVDWDAWFYKPGMPPYEPHFDNSLAAWCIDLSDKWVAAPEDVEKGSDVKFSAADLKNMTSKQIIEFLNLLLQKDPLPQAKLEAMRDLYGMEARKNSEIRFRWLRLCLKARLEAAVPLALDFATQYGRMKFTRPIFRDLYNWEEMRDRAIERFNKHKAEMHSTTAMLVAKDLHLS